MERSESEQLSVVIELADQIADLDLEANNTLQLYIRQREESTRRLQRLRSLLGKLRHEDITG